MDATRSEVVLYARVACSGGSDAIERQLTTLRKYAIDRNFYVAREFADDGVSGLSVPMLRPGIRALLAYCKHAPVRCVVVQDRSRLSRIRGDLERLESFFTSLGIAVCSTREEGRFEVSLPHEWSSLMERCASGKTTGNTISAYEHKHFYRKEKSPC